jgi:xanthine dehydrogenase accessory factor
VNRGQAPDTLADSGAPQALRRIALAWRAEGRPAAVVTVTAHRGSVPRETGTRMLVAADEAWGTIGGGHLELCALRDARALVAAGGPAVEQDVPLGPALGQCCGGVVRLRIAPLAAEDPDAWTLPAPRFTLQLHGAGHVGRAIARLLAGLPCTVQWIDARDDAFPPGALPSHVQAMATDTPEAEVAAAAPGCFFLVLTHSHGLDERIVQAVLRREDFGFLGLIGSRSKRQRFVHRLLARGVPAARLERMVCPIGLPGIPGKEPEVIAVAAVAQLLQTAAQAPAAAVHPRVGGLEPASAAPL